MDCNSSRLRCEFSLSGIPTMHFRDCVPGSGRAAMFIGGVSAFREKYPVLWLKSP
jgi:hypothetical protein